MDEVLPAALAALHSRIAKVFPAQIRVAVEPLTEEQIWWRPNESSNSIGNIVLHLTGSLNHFLNFKLGGIPYERNRAAEFAERRNIPKAELMKAFEDMVVNAEQTLSSLRPETLGSPSPVQELYRITFEDLIAIATHVANHAGQIVWIAKMFDGSAIDDLWQKTHRDLGAWKPKGA
jgi:hypothetical protein